MNVVGVDIGGTNIEAGLVNARGRILKKVNVKTEAEKGKKIVINNIIAAIEKVIRKDVIGIGIGAPGPLDIKKGVLGKGINIPLNNVPLANIVKNKFKKPVFLDNDANCFTLGETFFGANKGKNNVIGLTLGTGIGGGIVINKKLYHGRNNAGELGHIIIKFDGFKGTNGIRGSLESYIGKKAILRYSKGLTKSPLELYNKAMKGNYKAERVWKNIGRYLGIGITNLVHAFDPDIVVIGGKISKAWRFFHKTMEEEVKKRVLFKPCRIVKTRLGIEANILGAASLVFSAKNIYRN